MVAREQHTESTGRGQLLVALIAVTAVAAYVPDVIAFSSMLLVFAIVGGFFAVVVGLLMGVAK